MKGFLQKLTSRKLWMAIAGVATGIAIAFGVDSGEISTVAGAVLSVVSVVTYIVTEGKVDAEGVKNAIIAIDGVVDMLEGDEAE